MPQLYFYRMTGIVTSFSFSGVCNPERDRFQMASPMPGALGRTGGGIMGRMNSILPLGPGTGEVISRSTRYPRWMKKVLISRTISCLTTGSRTTPPFPRRSFPASELGFDQCQYPGVRCHEFLGSGHHQLQRDKGGVNGDQIHGFFRWCQRSCGGYWFAPITVTRDPGAGPGHLAVSYVTAYTCRGTVLEHAVGKTTGGSPHIQAGQTGEIQERVSMAFFEFQAPAAHIGQLLFLQPQGRCGCSPVVPALSTGMPLTRT